MINLLLVLADQEEAKRMYGVLQHANANFNCFCADDPESVLELLDDNIQTTNAKNCSCCRSYPDPSNLATGCLSFTP